MAKPFNTRPTVADVARASGVSIATVSQIINGKGRASAATREFVLKTAQAIGYDVNPVARSLRTGKTAVLGIFFRPADAVPGSLMGTEFHVRLAGSAAAKALSLGYGLLHTPNPIGLGAPAYPMDGCIVVGPVGNDEVVQTLLAKGIKIVCVDPAPDHPQVPFVGRDESPAIAGLLHHLKIQGACSYALIAVTDDNAWKRGFVRAFEDWCTADGSKGQVFELPGDTGSDGAQALVDRLISSGALPEAIVCATSRFAVGAAKAIEPHALKIPQDVLLAALSDSELARSHSPAITALDLHGDKLGEQAVALLVQQLEKSGGGTIDRIVPTLRLRASSQRHPAQ